jgi:RNA polymerase sigma-70 factor (ECF subfamily)
VAPLARTGDPPPGRAADLPLEEAALLQAAQAGDRDAFAALVAPLLPGAYQFALRVLGDPQLAEDVVQEALVRAYVGLTGFRGRAPFRTWVFRIVHNVAMDALRQLGRQHQETSWEEAASGEAGEEGEPRLAEVAPGPEETVLAALGREEILRAVAALPPEQRTVVVLRDVQGLSYGEIAAVTGQSLGTVKSRLHRARASLRAMLARPRRPAADAAAAPQPGRRGGTIRGVP